MLFSKGNISLCLAGAALVISCYGTFFQTKQPLINQLATDSEQQYNLASSDFDAVEHDDEQTLAKLNQSIISLKKQVAALRQGSASHQTITPDLKESVLAIIAEKEQQALEKAEQNNPIYGFYNSLPDDYELRLKSEPDYADSLNKQLREQIIDPYQSDKDRLKAMAQLQMNMFMLGKQTLPEYDYDIANSMLNIAANSQDNKLRVQAIELVSQSPILDSRLTQQYTQILERDDNEYIRRLAAQGILSQYFIARNEQADNSQQLAQQILTIYRHPINESVKSIIDEMIGDPNMLDELKKSAGE
ncbi:hypothetical protein AAEU31_15495 [Pseudoalteromonas sp. SSMSWG5]|uniref:hypothetical protein n=1 Tax=Pseudoalteromonas sp. SSMSWG5 TaxID=3139396 RepID=UPI003BAD13C6